MNNNTIQGLLSDYQPVRTDGTRTVIAYALTPVLDADGQPVTVPVGSTDGEEQPLYQWREIPLPKKQHPIVTADDAKKAILADINARTDERILTGFQYQSKPVYLSEENQRNFSEAQRVALMVPDQILPVTFKLGEQEYGTPVYHEFTTAEELTQFYLATVAYINEQLQQGWQEKDAIDLSPYEAALPSGASDSEITESATAE